jgi:hypothetical protein
MIQHVIDILLPELLTLVAEIYALWVAVNTITHVLKATVEHIDIERHENREKH